MFMVLRFRSLRILRFYIAKQKTRHFEREKKSEQPKCNRSNRTHSRTLDIVSINYIATLAHTIHLSPPNKT